MPPIFLSSHHFFFGTLEIFYPLILLILDNHVNLKASIGCRMSFGGSIIYGKDKIVCGNYLWKVGIH